MKVLKRNQVVIFVIALMLITAGYLNFIDTSKINSDTAVQTSADTFGDAMLVSSNVTKQEEITNVIAEAESEEKSDEYFTSTKMERDNMYSQIIESYQKMISEDSITAEQKAIAQNEITKINNTKNAIMITENLIKMKGFEDVIILVNNDSINVVIAKEKLIQEEVAQIQNIVSREMETEIENIHISSK